MLAQEDASAQDHMRWLNQGRDMPLTSSRRRFLFGSVAALASGGLPFWAGSRALDSQAWAADDPTPATIRLNGWLETRFEAWLATSPMQQSLLGLKSNFDKWDDLSPARSAEDRRRAEKDLADLRENFAGNNLTPEGRLSYRLYEYESQRRMADADWRLYAYPVNQMDGWQQQVASFLINIHQVTGVEDAEAYVARLNGVGTLLDQVIDTMREAEAAGVLAPRFVYGHVIRDCRNLLAGAPFGAGKDSPLYADFTGKLDGIKGGRVVKQALRGDAATALIDVVGPAYRKLITFAEGQQARAGTDDGVWRLPDGEAYYARQLEAATTTAMTAAEIHAFGLAEVERIQGEMRTVMQAAKFKGDLKAFFAFLKSDPQFRYPQTPEGKAAYLRRVDDIITAMTARLPEAFSHRPTAPLAVRAVAPFREQSATTAFYQGPADDGRPGTYYINTFDMTALPTYELEALAYHEGVPGHHLQVSVARTLADLPRFRRFSSSFTAYAEGWGVYAERLAKDMGGCYQNPTDDFGRLSSELWRACRLVVDTGIHSGDTRWSRDKAIGYLRDTTPNADSDIINSVERYIVNPGQATAYTIGMARMLESREDAKTRLGDRFDLRAFHDVVLNHGRLPLTMLAENIDAWVKETST